MGDYEGFPAKQENKEAIYRVDAQSGRVEMLADDVDKPNGICFSHDYKKLYVVNTGSPKEIVVWDINGTKLAGRKQFTNFMVQGKGQAGGDGVRVDVDGNVWAAASGGPGLDGVIIFTPAGERIGQILLPEICANLCFGGPKRNRLYMTGSQSLYSVYVNTRGAHVS
jgi:gluconolactonase